MQQQEIIDGLLDFAQRELLHGNADDLDADTPLLELGVLDSLSMVGLLSYVDEAFGVRIPEEDVVPEHFDTLRSIAALVASQTDTMSAGDTGTERSELHQLVALQETYGIRSRMATLPSGARAHSLSVPGDGPTYLMIPALGNPSTSFGPGMRSLSGRRAAVAIDMPGFGLSEVAAPRYGSDAPVYRDHVDFLLEFVDHEVSGPLVLIGSSAGAMVAAEVARQRPDRAVALIVTGFGLIDDVPAWWDGLRAMSQSPNQFLDAAYYKAPPLTPALERLLHQVLARPAYMSFLDEHAVGAMRTTFEDLRLPVLFAAGQDDRIIPADAVEAAAKRVPGARIEWLARCGHFPPAERPEPFLWLAGTFVESICPEEQ